MPINVYTGLMRSGKSYEVVSNPILDAIAQGRRVVTNVDGISSDLVREYVAKTRKLDIEKLGTVVHVVNADVFKPDFLPYFDDDKTAHTNTICQPGDLVCVDEAWRFWGTDCKLEKNHKSFFLEHGHFTDEKTGVACDLILMIQDMSTLHRFVKNVVAFSFRTHKKVSLGMNGTYSVTMWEGPKTQRATEIGNWVRRYNKEIFPLYSSFKGGADGKLVNADSRQNIFSNKWLWVKLLLVLLIGIFAIRNVWNFFRPADADVVVVASEKGVPAAGPSGSLGSPAPVFSPDWRIVGSVTVDGKGMVLVSDPSGRIRVESPSVFQLSGLARMGQIDGQRVTTFSGVPAKSVFSSVQPGPTK